MASPTKLAIKRFFTRFWVGMKEGAHTPAISLKGLSPGDALKLKIALLNYQSMHNHVYDLRRKDPRADAGDIKAAEADKNRYKLEAGGILSRVGEKEGINKDEVKKIEAILNLDPERNGDVIEITCRDTIEKVYQKEIGSTALVYLVSGILYGAAYLGIAFGGLYFFGIGDFALTSFQAMGGMTAIGSFVGLCLGYLGNGNLLRVLWQGAVGKSKQAKDALNQGTSKLNKAGWGGLVLLLAGVCVLIGGLLLPGMVPETIKTSTLDFLSNDAIGIIGGILTGAVFGTVLGMIGIKNALKAIAFPLVVVPLAFVYLILKVTLFPPFIQIFKFSRDWKNFGGFGNIPNKTRRLIAAIPLVGILVVKIAKRVQMNRLKREWKEYAVPKRGVGAWIAESLAPPKYVKSKTVRAMRDAHLTFFPSAGQSAIPKGKEKEEAEIADVFLKAISDCRDGKYLLQEEHGTFVLFLPPDDLPLADLQNKKEQSVKQLKYLYNLVRSGHYEEAGEHKPQAEIQKHTQWSKTNPFKTATEVKEQEKGLENELVKVKLEEYVFTYTHAIDKLMVEKAQVPENRPRA